MPGILLRAMRRLRHDGPVATFRHALRRAAESYYERRFGIRTAQIVQLSELGIDNPAFHKYSPTDYRSFFSAMRHVPIRNGQDVFFDYGSGMGRVLIMAATYPFRKVLGVEIAPQLNDIARENIHHVRKKLKCRDIQVITADAATYALPAEVTVIHFYNPFRGEVLRRVLENIRDSLAKSPRKVTILYKNPEHLEGKIDLSGWLTRRMELPGRSGTKYVIYESRPPAPSPNT